MKKLSDIVTIERRFARSARIEADLNGTPPLVGYVLQGSAEKSLEVIAHSQIDTKQGAYTWTGPYGGGKSSAALLLANLVAGSKDGKAIARKIAGPSLTKLMGRAFPERAGDWVVVPITGTRGNLSDAISRALAPRLKWSQKVEEAARLDHRILIASLLNALERRSVSVLLIVDELGKFLEQAVNERGDIHLLQELAEHSSRSKGRFVILGILHQSFDRYAEKLGQDARQEWAKVQGRYQDISFLAGADETVSLLGRAIRSTATPREAKQVAAAVAASVAKRRPTDVQALSAALEQTWPLNPVTSLLLGPISKQRFAQNERSVFGFLSSGEPFGFQEFLQSTTQADGDFGPDRLWDYLNANFGMALMAGNDGHRLSLALEAIDRAAAKGNRIHVAVTKTAAIIDIFRNGSGLTVSEDCLISAMPEVAPSAVKAAIRNLTDWAILIKQPRLGGYAMFAGSDFDLDSAMSKARTGLAPNQFSALPKKIGLGFVAAKHHYFRTGALRAFDLLLHSFDPAEPVEAAAEKLARYPRAGAGLMVLLLSDGLVARSHLSAYARGLSRLLYSGGIPVAVSAVSQDSRLGELAADLFALDTITREHRQLEGDQIARREVTARRSLTQDQIEDDLRAGLEDSTWFVCNSEDAVRRSQSEIATLVADYAFYSAPIIRSELVQRDRASSSAMAAVRELLHAMSEHSDLPDLGIEGFPAEKGLYLTTLKPAGVHREADGGAWRFTAPNRSETGKSLKAAWDVLDANELVLNDVYEKWARPPFGVKHAAMPILALAGILARRDRLAVYIDGLFQTKIDALFADKLLQNPGAVRLRKIHRSVEEASFLNGLAQVLDVAGEPAALPIAQALFRRIQALPEYAKRTDGMLGLSKTIRNTVLSSDDPEKLLFDNLIKLQSVDVADSVEQAISDCESAYPALLDKLRKALAKALGVDPVTFEGVGERADIVMGLTNDLRFDAFALRVQAFEVGAGEIEGLASLLIHRPPRVWSDRDVDSALLEIARIGRRFREAEALAIVRQRKTSTEALALVVGLDPKMPAVLTSFELTKSEKTQATALADKLIKSMGEQSSPVRLAALARAVASLVGDTSLEPI